MPRATVTSRVLKNQNTGIEMYVPTYKQTKELLTSVVHYQVILASNLACFKSPSHKESDVVQYSIEKKISDFEELRTKIAENFPGTMLPPINKKSIIVNEAVLKERRNSLDHLIKIISSTPKLATCVPVLVFLGIDPVRAKKFSKGEPLEKKEVPADDHEDIAGDGDDEQGPVVFGGEDEDDSGNEEMFGDEDNEDDTGDMFTSIQDDSKKGAFKVFEGQDLKRDLTEEDENDFSFVPNAILTKKEVVREPLNFGEEDNSDLFEIEDDLDKLMNFKSEKKTTQDGGDDAFPSPLTSSTKPTVPSKKPTIPSKPKPSIASKPNFNEHASASASSSKPAPPQKPIPPPKKESGADKGVKSADNLGQDDIMKYLQDNLDSNAEEVDLFS